MRYAEGLKKRPTTRSLSVAQNVKKALADIFMRDSIFGLLDRASIVTVTEVRMSPDMRQATCYISFFKAGATEEDEKDFFVKLNALKVPIRKSLASAVSLKSVPVLLFKSDKVVDKARTRERILAAIESAK